MGVRLEYTCDGCGKVAFREGGMGKPETWGRVTIAIDGLNACFPPTSLQNGRNTYDLCPSCQHKLVAGAFPSQWLQEAPVDAR